MNRYQVVRTARSRLWHLRAWNIELLLFDTETNTVLLYGVLSHLFTERDLKTHEKIMNVTARLLNRGSLRVRTIMLEHLAKLHQVMRIELGFSDKAGVKPEKKSFGADFGNVCASEREGSFGRRGRVDGYW